MDETYAYCSLPQVPPREFPAGTDPARVEAILVNESNTGRPRTSAWSSSR